MLSKQCLIRNLSHHNKISLFISPVSDSECDHRIFDVFDKNSLHSTKKFDYHSRTIFSASSSHHEWNYEWATKLIEFLCIFFFCHHRHVGWKKSVFSWIFKINSVKIAGVLVAVDFFTFFYKNSWMMEYFYFLSLLKKYFKNSIFVHFIGLTYLFIFFTQF